MTDLPEKFDVEIIDWQHADRLCRRVRDQIHQDTFNPDAVIGIARGGWFPARSIADLLHIEDLSSVKIEHHTGINKSDTATVRYQIDPASVEGKTVLIVDDSIDSGETLTRARRYLREYEPNSIESAVLQEFSPEQGHDVTYSATTYEEWRFITNPWEFMENMVDMVNGVLVKDAPGTSVNVEYIYNLLNEYHGLTRASVEMAQGPRLEEVLEELTRMDVVAKDAAGWQLLETGIERYQTL